MAQTNERRKNMATTSEPTPEPPTSSVSTPAFRAAQYVRMSTEHQQYSTHNQADKIQEYADRRNIQIVRTYADEGKSWSPIRSTLGVSQLVHFGARAAKVDGNLVDLLRKRERAMPTEAMFHSGDSVVVTDGPFTGIEAIYQTADAERRAFILLEILAKPVSMRIDTTLLRKTG